MGAVAVISVCRPEADREMLNPAVVDHADQLGDAAKAGRWSEVLELVEAEPARSANPWRIGGRSWFAPLYQAAWLGAPLDVVERMIDLGAWRSPRAADGDRPVDIARKRGHEHLLEALAVRDPSAREERQFAARDRNLSELIDERSRTLDAVRFRPVPTELFAREKIDIMRFPYPGMYGGFSISLHKNRLVVESWSKAVSAGRASRPRPASPRRRRGPTGWSAAR